MASSLMIKIPKFEETEGDCGQTVKYDTGKGTFTVVSCEGEFFFKIQLIWVIVGMVRLFSTLNVARCYGGAN